VATLTRPLVLATLVGGLLAVASPSLVRRVPDVREAIGAERRAVADEQSSSQISRFEFDAVATGTSPARLEAAAGEPASRSVAEVEGVRVECWYYGVAGRSGAYQLCFENGRLTSKMLFARGA
jgi:hypothetical protein